MTKDQQIKILTHCFDEVIWMAIRYADGRHTYAPSMVRDAIKQFQTVNPDWKPREDKTIEQPVCIKFPDSSSGVGMSFDSDWLYDLVNTK
jgi:hypothetical protein